MKKHLTYLLISLLLTACSNDADAPGMLTERPITIGVDAGLSLTLDNGRAIGDEVKAVYPSIIGVYGYIPDDKSIFENQKMYLKGSDAAQEIADIAADWPSENLWPYNPPKYWESGKHYSFYAYAPYNAYDAQMVVTADKSMKSFTMTNIPPISSTEFVVSRNVVNVNSLTEPTFLMQHLTSRLRFLFKIEDEYSKLRDIHVKSISITDEAAAGSFYWDYRTDFTAEGTTLTPNSTSYTPIGNIQLIPEVDAEKLVLTTEYQAFSSAYNLINTIPTTTLTVVYDVYDKKGVLTRENQSTSNQVLLTQFTTLEKGYCYDVYILVAPKYLYVLSDNDVQPDSVIEVTE